MGQTIQTVNGDANNIQLTAKWDGRTKAAIQRGHIDTTVSCNLLKNMI